MCVCLFIDLSVHLSIISYCFKEPSPIQLEEGMATRSSILAWRIPWTEEPGGLQSTGWQRVGHDWTYMRWHSSLPNQESKAQEDGEGGGRGGSGWETHVHPWLIHVSEWQKPLQYFKVISVQLKWIIKKIKTVKKKEKKEQASAAERTLAFPCVVFPLQ